MAGGRESRSRRRRLFGRQVKGAGRRVTAVVERHGDGRAGTRTVMPGRGRRGTRRERLVRSDQWRTSHHCATA